MSRLYYKIVCLLFCLALLSTLAAQELIYTEDFSATPPMGWTFMNIGAGGNWNPCIENGPWSASYSGTHLMRYARSDWNEVAANAWAFTKSFELTAGNHYYLDFFQKTNRAYEWMKVSVGSAATVGAQTKVLLDLARVQHQAYINRVTDIFVPRTTGTYYFAFNCFTPSNTIGSQVYVDLLKLYEISNGSGVASIGEFTAASVHPNRVELNWQLNLDQNPVLIAFNTVNVFGNPVAGESYDPINNSTIPGGGTVIYSGGDSDFIHTALEPLTHYYYKIWSIGADNFSVGLDASCTTPSEPSVSAPYSEGFDHFGEMAPGWSRSSQGSGNWDFVSSDTAHGASAPHEGTYFARVNSYSIGFENNPLRLISPPLDLRGDDKEISYWAWRGAQSWNPYPITLEISLDNKQTWTQFYVGQSPYGVWAKHTVSLADYHHAAAYISITGMANWGINQCNIGVDSFVFRNIVSSLSLPILQIEKVDAGVQVSWAAVPNATSYRIEASDYPDSGFAELTISNENYYLDPAQNKRFYRVYAICD
ncbi:MAG: hypothetical protein LHW56_04695 [Candidatus Cloacimonetes bacterium]|nr:hypothetical protein [Candidatus Cloacimonadota bacterium]MDY0172187.1 hypothetical protein [Candidatus Cloacimonadaceae bacterium]